VPDNLDYLAVSGMSGQLVYHELTADIEDMVDWEGDFSYRCENRDAQVVDSQPAADGVLDFLVYEKWGEINLNIRWRSIE